MLRTQYLLWIAGGLGLILTLIAAFNIGQDVTLTQELATKGLKPPQNNTGFLMLITGLGFIGLPLFSFLGKYTDYGEKNQFFASSLTISLGLVAALSMFDVFYSDSAPSTLYEAYYQETLHELGYSNVSLSLDGKDPFIESVPSEFSAVNAQGVPVTLEIAQDGDEVTIMERSRGQEG